jgi:hypothetical protein
MRGCDRSEVYYWYFWHDIVQSGGIKIIIYGIVFLPVVYVGFEFGLSREVKNMGLSDEETGDWRNLRKEKLHDLYCSVNIIRMITSRWVSLAAYVARTAGQERGIQGFGGET